MQPFYLIFVTLSLVLSCSLSVSKKVTKEKTQSLTKDARVQKKWQKFVLSEMAKNEASESWGLVSQSAMADHGQKFVLYGKKPKVYIVEPTKTDLSETKDLDEKKLAEFKDKISKLASLSSMTTPSFDGIEYEYFHYKEKDNEIYLIQRVYMRNPGVEKDQQDYTNLIGAFDAL